MGDSTRSRAAIKRGTLAAHRQVEDLDQEAMDALEKAYRKAAEEIGRDIRRAAGQGDTVPLQELRRLLAQVEERLSDLSRLRNGTLNDVLSRAAELGADAYGLDASARLQVSQTALRFVQTLVAADGLQLSDRIWRLDRGAREAVVDAIEQAVVRGYGAAEAARDFLTRGQPVPLDAQAAIDGANAQRLARHIGDQLIAAPGSPMDHAMRLFRTELNRAHGEAYMLGGEGHPDFAGWRFLLSPAHPEPDICDLLSEQNLHGLGRGVYPSRETCPWPAHPNTLSFVEIVFKDEITEADRAGQETPMEALARLTDGQQLGVLGKNKHQAFKDGQLTQGMIRAPWSAVKERLQGGLPDTPPRPAPPVTKPKTPRGSLDDMIQKGRAKADALLQGLAAGEKRWEELQAMIHEDLNKSRSTNKEVKVCNGGKGAEYVRAVSRLFPDDWTKASDDLGPLYAKFENRRAFHIAVPEEYAGMTLRIKGFGVQRVAGGDGFIMTRGYRSALHEFTHRLQHALPALDDFFQELHQRRTAGDPLKSLDSLHPGVGYAISEVTREDHYVIPYQGKVYSGSRYLGRDGALEVMTIAFEYLFGSPESLRLLVEADPEMFNLVLGLLHHYEP